MEGETKRGQESWVMVVDDDEALLRSAGMLLEEEGLKVVLCLGGKEALDKFDERIRAVVLDMGLSDMLGLEVFKRIKDKNPLVPVIIYTGTSERCESIKKELNPYACMLKGDNIDKFISLVISAVKSYVG